MQHPGRMTDQPTGRDTIMGRDEVADEAGREHTGGLGERGGADTAGGAIAGSDENATEEPSREERQGLGDVGRHAESEGDQPADVGERD